MSNNLSWHPSPGPLSIGNVVSAALRIYKDHFKSYLGVAFRATLWAGFPVVILLLLFLLLLISIIGVLSSQVSSIVTIVLLVLSIIVFLFLLFNCAAMFLTNLGLICRLCYQELINKPESVKQLYCQTILPKKWRFWQVGLLTGVLVFAVNYIAQRLLVTAPQDLASNLPNHTRILFLLIGQILYYTIYLWISARLFIPEVPLAIETNLTSINSVARSWELTKGYAWKIAVIILVATLVTLPVYIFAAIPLFIGFGATMPLWTQTSESLFDIGYLVTIFSVFVILAFFIFMSLNIIAIPFWQALKAVIYYDLRSRKEGLDLAIRDSAFDE